MFHVKQAEIVSPRGARCFASAPSGTARSSSPPVPHVSRETQPVLIRRASERARCFCAARQAFSVPTVATGTKPGPPAPSPDVARALATLPTEYGPDAMSRVTHAGPTTALGASGETRSLAGPAPSSRAVTLELEQARAPVGADAGRSHQRRRKCPPWLHRWPPHVRSEARCFTWSAELAARSERCHKPRVFSYLHP